MTVFKAAFILAAFAGTTALLGIPLAEAFANAAPGAGINETLVAGMENSAENVSSGVNTLLQSFQ